MAALTATTVATLGGIADIGAAAVAAAVGGDTAPVGPANIFLLVVNGGGSSCTATISTPGTVAGHAVADATLVVAAGKSGIIPLTNLFRGATGRAAITYSAVTSVTVAVFTLGA